MMKIKTTAVIAIFLLSTVLCFSQGYDFMVRTAERKLMSSQFQEAIDIYMTAFKSGEFHYDDYIHVAQASASLKDADMAFKYLHKAVEAGYCQKVQLLKFPCLQNLHGDKRWPVLMEKVEKLQTFMKTGFPEKHAEKTVIDLPKPRLDSGYSVEKAIQNRRSIRSYTEAPLTLPELAQLLWAAYGITKPMKNSPDFIRGGLRAPPSAGARYPLEVYVVVRNVTGLKPSVYWYKSEVHKLVQVVKEDRWEAVSESAFHQPHFKTAAAALIWSGIFERNMAKYGQRGRERYVCMDLGHSGENVYLQCMTLNIGTCAIGAFNDLWLKKACNMTLEEEPLYIMPVGKVE
jgi:SagB-type dehydrogenase family enzyme